MQASEKTCGRSKKKVKGNPCKVTTRSRVHPPTHGYPKFTPGRMILAGCRHHLTLKQHGGAQTTMAAPMCFKRYYSID